MMIVQIIAHFITMTAITIMALMEIYFFFELFRTRFFKYPPMIHCPNRSLKRVMTELGEILSDGKKHTIADIGSGTGSIIIPLAKKFPEHTFVGIEYGWPISVAKLKSRKIKNIIWIKNDVFKEDLSKYDTVIYFFLQDLMDKFIDHLRQGRKGEKTFLISVRFKTKTNQNIIELKRNKNITVYSIR